MRVRLIVRCLVAPRENLVLDLILWVNIGGHISIQQFDMVTVNVVMKCSKTDTDIQGYLKPQKVKRSPFNKMVFKNMQILKMFIFD